MSDDEILSDVTILRDQLDAAGRMLPHRLIVALGLIATTAEARRVIEQGGVNIGSDRTSVTDPKAPIIVTDGLIVRVGKHKAARVRLEYDSGGGNIEEAM